MSALIHVIAGWLGEIATGARRRLFLPALILTCAPAATVSAADADENEVAGFHMVRVTAQFVRVPHALLTELMAAPDTRGHILHERVMERVRKGEATITDTAMVTGKSGQKSTVESIEEFIYPCEYEPPGQDFHSFPPGTTPPPLTPGFTSFRPPMTYSWDTRNTGFTLEVEPTISDNETIIDLRLVPEIVSLVRLDTWQEHHDRWGDASIRMPVFQTLRPNTSLNLIPGRFDLLSVLTPKPATPGPAVLQKTLVFIRADILAVGGSPVGSVPAFSHPIPKN